jgi:AraC-like DNA-binding protein
MTNKPLIRLSGSFCRPACGFACWALEFAGAIAATGSPIASAAGVTAYGLPTETGRFLFVLTLTGLLLLGGALLSGVLLWRKYGQTTGLEHQVKQLESDLRQAKATIESQAAEIRHHSEQVQSLIDQAYYLERIGREGAGEIRPVALRPMLARALEGIRIAAEKKAIEVRDRVQDLEHDPWVKVDRVRLEHALMILLDNATRYVPRGGVVRLGLTLPPFSGFAAIHVEDNGPWIAPERREGIFEPLVQADSEQPGLGLGLALCRRIIEQHGGTMTLEDSELGGACFTVELPLVATPVQASGESDSATSESEPGDDSALPEKSSSVILRLEQILSDHLDDPDLDVDQLTVLSGTSRASLYRRLQEHCSMTPAEFIRDFRLRRAAELLERGDARVSEVALAVGFRHLSSFTRTFRARYDCTPSQYRKNGRPSAT